MTLTFLIKAKMNNKLFHIESFRSYIKQMLTNDSISFKDVNITNVLSKWLLDFQENELCSNVVHIENDFGKTSVQYFFPIFTIWHAIVVVFFYTGIKDVEMMKVHINFVGSFPRPFTEYIHSDFYYTFLLYLE